MDTVAESGFVSALLLFCGLILASMARTRNEKAHRAVVGSVAALVFLAMAYSAARSVALAAWGVQIPWVN